MVRFRAVGVSSSSRRSADRCWLMPPEEPPFRFVLLVSSFCCILIHLSTVRSTQSQRLTCKKRGFMKSSALTAVGCFLVLTPVTVWAQGLSGSIVGSITDPANAVVPNAKVTIKNVNTNATVSATTNAVGQYRALGLIPGDYTVTVEAPGFRKTTTSPQTVDISTPMRVDLKLEVGQVTEVVSIEEAAAQIDT